MNILFFTDKNVDPLIGGIERITYALAETLCKLYGYECHSLYTQENHRGTSTEGVFSSKTLIDKDNAIEQISKLIQSKQINIIVAQGSAEPVHKAMPIIRKAADQADNKTKIVFVFHNMPGHEFISMDMGALLQRFLHTSDKVWALKQLLIQISKPLIRPLLKKQLKKKYALPYQLSDKVVLLSQGFIQRYNELSHTGTDKFAVIGNSLTLAAQEPELTKKESIVLMVTRLDERHKRVKAALRIWQQIEHDPSLQPWRLVIVGYGPEADYYKQLTQKWQLQRVGYTGLADPIPYYQKAQVFLMTSAFEGWGLTLTEAEQCGCVPMAFDSYEAVHDILSDGYNGFIIPDNDIQAYSERLSTLLKNPELMLHMQENALQDCLRHSQERVAQQWNELFQKL